MGGVTFDRPTADRVLRATALVERLLRGDAAGPAARATPTAPVVQLLEATGASDGSGYFAAKVVTWDEATSKYLDLGEVKGKETNGAAVETGDRLLCRFTGEKDGKGLFVGAAAGEGGGDCPDIEAAFDGCDLQLTIDCGGVAKVVTVPLPTACITYVADVSASAACVDGEVVITVTKTTAKARVLSCEACP